MKRVKTPPIKINTQKKERNYRESNLKITIFINNRNSHKMPFKTNQFPLHRKVELIRKNRIPTTQIYKIVVSPLVLQEHPIVSK